MTYTSLSSPTPEDMEELLLIARYGELDELKSFIEKFGTKPLIDARDEDGNTILHMVCGNGHLGTNQFSSEDEGVIPMFIYGLDSV
jgi:ankyrin repeat protein